MENRKFLGKNLMENRNFLLCVYNRPWLKSMIKAI